MKVFSCKSQFAIGVEELFQFHESKTGFESLVGAIPGIEVIQQPQSISVGEMAILRIPIFLGIKTNWKALHTIYQKNKMFQDEQIEGPFRYFKHSHIFSPYPNNSKFSLLEDRIEFEAFFPYLTNSILPIILSSQFKNRHSITAKILDCEYRLESCGLTSNS